jgi:hypothetical protein
MSFGNRTMQYTLPKTDFFKNTFFQAGKCPCWASPAANQDFSDPSPNLNARTATSLLNSTGPENNPQFRKEKSD